MALFTSGMVSTRNDSVSSASKHLIVPLCAVCAMKVTESVCQKITQKLWMNFDKIFLMDGTRNNNMQTD